MLQRLEEIIRLLVEGQKRPAPSVFDLMDTDIKAEFERLSQESKKILRWTQARFDYYAGLRAAREVSAL